MLHHPHENPAAVSHQTPFAAGLALSFANSVASGVVGNSIFVLTKHGYGFDRTTNYTLALSMGMIYIVGAAAAGPALRALNRRFGLTSKTALAGMMVAMFLLCAIPWLSARFSPSATSPPQVIWIVATLYNALNGAIWPVIESYISGGRSGKDLRRALGLWNAVWSSSLVVAVIGIAPLVRTHALLAILGLGVMHLIGLFVLIPFAKEPMPHIEEHHQPAPPVYSKLLVTFRMLLPTSYMVLSTLNPFLPDAAQSLGLSPGWQAALAAAWLLPRCLTFVVLERTHAWHGKWSTPVLGAIFMLVGFAVAIMTPRVLSGWPGILLVVLGLVAFGIGMATIYTGALYYAMAVGKAEIDAGGAHEALIGVGYTVGPLIGLGASLAAARGTIPLSSFEPAVIAAVTLAALVVTALVVSRVRRLSRPIPS